MSRVTGRADDDRVVVVRLPVRQLVLRPVDQVPRDAVVLREQRGEAWRGGRDGRERRGGEESGLESRGGPGRGG